MNESLEELLSKIPKTLTTGYRTVDDFDQIHHSTPLFFHLSFNTHNGKDYFWVAGYYHTHIPELSWVEDRDVDPKQAVIRLMQRLNVKEEKTRGHSIPKAGGSSATGKTARVGLGDS